MPTMREGGDRSTMVLIGAKEMRRKLDPAIMAPIWRSAFARAGIVTARSMKPKIPVYTGYLKAHLLVQIDQKGGWPDWVRVYTAAPHRFLVQSDKVPPHFAPFSKDAGKYRQGNRMRAWVERVVAPHMLAEAVDMGGNRKSKRLTGVNKLTAIDRATFLIARAMLRRPPKPRPYAKQTWAEVGSEVRGLFDGTMRELEGIWAQR